MPSLIEDFIILFYWRKIALQYHVGLCHSESPSVVSDSLRPRGLCPWNSPGQNTGVGSHSFL